MIDIQTKENRWKMAGMIVGTLVLAFVVAPVIVLTLKSLVALLICVVIAFVSWKMLPWFGMMVSNLALRAVKAEARANPIETLQNGLLAKLAGLAKYKESLTTFKGEIDLFRQKLMAYAKKFPADKDGIANFQDQLDKMNKLWELRIEKYKQTAQALADLQDRINWASEQWEMQKAAAAMKDAAGITGDKFLDDIAQNEAFNSVQKAVANAFAETDVAFALDINSVDKHVAAQVAAPAPVVEIEGQAPQKALPSAFDSIDISDLTGTKPEPVPVPAHNRYRTRS